MSSGVIVTDHKLSGSWDECYWFKYLLLKFVDVIYIQTHCTNRTTGVRRNHVLEMKQLIDVLSVSVTQYQSLPRITNSSGASEKTSTDKQKVGRYYYHNNSHRYRKKKMTKVIRVTQKMYVKIVRVQNIDIYSFIFLLKLYIGLL